MDPYAILGVPRGCSRDRVKEAFRALVQRAHPDRGGDGEAFVRLCDAYRQVLADIERGDDQGRDRDRSDPAPAGEREDYLAWMRQLAEESARRRSAPWWRKHPREARAGLLGLIGLVGLLVLAAAMALGTRSAHRGGRRPAQAGRRSTIPGARPVRASGPLSRTEPSAAVRY